MATRNLPSAVSKEQDYVHLLGYTKECVSISFAPEYLGVIQICTSGVLEVMVVSYTSLYSTVAAEAEKGVTMEAAENWFRTLSQEKASTAARAESAHDDQEHRTSLSGPPLQPQGQAPDLLRTDIKFLPCNLQVATRRRREPVYSRVS